jgi:hypothetical protein
MWLRIELQRLIVAILEKKVPAVAGAFFLPFGAFLRGVLEKVGARTWFLDG